MKLKQAQKIYAKLSKAYHEAIRDMNLQEMRIRVKDIFLLVHIKEFAEGKSVSEMAAYKMQNECIGIRTEKDVNNFKVKISKTIKRYVQLGLIETIQDEQDKRTHRIYVTSKGQKIIEEIESKVQVIWKEKYEDQVTK
ncbi:MarR family winged helix-turn-helix transcriptional regulator [Mycoplasma todarodis]|uniref:MarR family winged helix-turn-helix transcriptional regulator n=1 Tax=Mycoplasma todarodis TaxID=1937191 RepID=UPI003B2FF23B